MSELAPGAYELLVTARLARLLQDSSLIPRLAALDDSEAPAILARHIASAAEHALSRTGSDAERRRLVNNILGLLDAGESVVEEGLEQLLYLEAGPGLAAKSPVRPLTPLSDAALITNARHEPSLGAELRSELASADRVDLLCAFVRWHGVRILEDAFEDLQQRGIRLRVLTTTYMGATERRALDALARRFGAEVRIAYEHQSTRLHAKAWLIERDSGFTTALVGSSNLSKSALLDGLEWNVRLSTIATPNLIAKFRATFDTYWEDQYFARYDPDADADRLDAAIARAGGSQSGGDVINISGLEVRPFPHQEQILEALETERVVHDRHRNLVVAATGTGKTVVAALDYRRLASALGRRPSLLFVAHRKEILDQTLRTYREVLSSASFGEEYVAGDVPLAWKHVFASVQSVAARGLSSFGPKQFEIIVVDEFHHAEAPTYRRMLDHFQPTELLGLTATPERTDGVDVRSFFDGRAAYEMHLWDALSDDLLVPFHYFGVADDVDLSGVEWKRGSYDVAGLENLYTGNDARVARVLTEVRAKVTDPLKMRALGYCVSVAHAEYMATRFNQAGIPSAALSGSSPTSEREACLRALRECTINVLFAVDLFNEGLDIPEIDTVLFLRPTQSATVFIQQLGRGLRRAPEKQVLTALDFIGQHRREFRMDVRYQALVGGTRKGLLDQLDRGFPYLPSGSQIVLDRISRERVILNVRQHVASNVAGLAAELRAIGDVPLDRFLADTQRGLEDIYRARGSWTEVRRLAGLPTADRSPESDVLLARVSKLAHVDDPERAALYMRLCTSDAPKYGSLTPREQSLARMLFFTIWPDKGGYESFAEGLAHLSGDTAFGAEARELIGLGLDRARWLGKPLGEGLQAVPMLSHATYRREEILAGLRYSDWTRSAKGHVSGVAWCPATATDALLVNLRKTEAEFSPSTMYRDYAISPELFHWESQNATTADSAVGRRYLSHVEGRTRVVLFVRDAKLDSLGAAPFTCLGQATLAQHKGERPMAITWRLARAMPGDVFAEASVVAR